MPFCVIIEAARLNVGSVDLKNKLIYVKTKTNQLAKAPIIEQLRPSLETILLQENYPDNYSLFSPSGKPDLWPVSEKAKVDFFSKRFKKVKKHFGLDKNYTLYSFRHTFCLNLYHSPMKQGLTDREAVLKMLPITCHANENGLKNYLRGVGASTPKDYGDIYTIDY